VLPRRSLFLHRKAMVARGSKQMAAKKPMAKISDSQSLGMTLLCYRSFIPLRDTYIILEAQK
jgi:hypothetical protein